MSEESEHVTVSLEGRGARRAEKALERHERRMAREATRLERAKHRPHGWTFTLTTPSGEKSYTLTWRWLRPQEEAAPEAPEAPQAPAQPPAPAEER